MVLDKKSSVQLTTGQLIPAFALVDDSGNQISDFTISAGIVTVTNIVNEVEIKNDSGNPIPVSDNGNSITVDGKARLSAVSITRPSNTTGYTAGDVIGVADSGTPANAGSAIHTLSGIGPSGGYVMIQSLRLLIGLNSVTSGMGAFRLHFYDESPTVILDNASLDLVSGDVNKYCGYIDIPTPLDFGSVLVSQVDYPGTLIKLGTGSTSLYVELETRGTFVPASGTVFNIQVLTLEAGL